MESLIPDLQNIVYKYVHEMMMEDVIDELLFYYMSQIKSYENLILYNKYTYYEPSDVELSKKQIILKRIIYKEMHIQALIDDGRFTYEEINDFISTMNHFNNYLKE